MVMHKYTEEEKAFLQEFVPGHSHKEITEEFNRRFSANITVGQIKSSIIRYSLNTGRTGRFEKGHKTHNKGKKGVCAKGCEKTWFKKGRLPHNTKPIGYERVSKDGYIEVKIAMRPSDTQSGRNFVLKHRLIYEQANGPIPKGYNVIFLDGDKRNFDLENLALVTDAENLELTRAGLRSEAAQFTETGVLIARSTIATRKAKKRKKENENAIKKQSRA